VCGRLGCLDGLGWDANVAADSYIAPMVLRPLSYDAVDRARVMWEAHGWGDAVPGMAAVTSIMRLHHALLARGNDLLAPLGLSFARYEVLSWIAENENGALALGELSDLLRLAPGTITNSVDRLERDGLIRRVPHPTDGRTTLAQITARGRDLTARATQALNDGLFKAVPLNRIELELLFQLVQKIRVAFGEFVPAVGPATSEAPDPPQRRRSSKRSRS